MTIKELGEKCLERTNNKRYPCDFCPFIKECKKCRKELPFMLTHEIPIVLEKQLFEL